MTFTAKELRAQGVDEAVIAWRAWRRRMHVTLPEAAEMAEVSPDWLHKLEVGRRLPQDRPERMAALRALMARWPEAKQP